MERIYLDNAATSWPKPESVYASVENAMRSLGAAAGRGSYRDAIEAGRLIEQTRGGVAELINAPYRRNVSFSFNGTDSLSTAIFGLLRQGDHVVTSAAEHNSVLRPLRDLESRGLIEVSCVGCDEHGAYSEDDIIAAVRPETRLVCLIHVSNVTGTIEPIGNIKSRCRAKGNQDTIFLIDAAQSLGHIPIDVQELGIDILAAPGHKGMLGPLGTGVLYVSDSIVDAVRPLRFGGTGTDGSVEIQPTKAPDKFESGNLNVPGNAGLNAGIDFLNSNLGDEAKIRRDAISQTMLEGILSLSGVTLHGPRTMQNRIGVFSLSIDGFDCHEAAAILDANWSIQTRAGLHCAPLIHQAMGTDRLNGTIRLSVGLFNTQQHVETTLEALSQLAGSC